MGSADDTIRKATDAIVRAFRPHRVILFGSRAYGVPREDSDIDLLVLLPIEGSELTMMSRLHLVAHHAVGEDVSFDILAREPGDAMRRLQAGDAFLREIMTRGVVLYEAAA